MSSSPQNCHHSSRLACGFTDCCSSPICHNVTINSNSCPREKQSNVTVTVIRYKTSGCFVSGDDPYLNWNQCPPTLSYLIDDPQSCCMNETSQCTSCSQVESNQSWFLILDAGSEVSPSSPVNSPSASSNTTDTSGEANLTSTTKISATPTSSTAQIAATQNSVSDSQSTTTPVGRPVSSDSRSSNTAAVAGGVTGGIVALALLLAILVVYCRRRITGPLKNADQRKISTWGSGEAHPIQAGDAELQEIKQGRSPSN